MDNGTKPVKYKKGHKNILTNALSKKTLQPLRQSTSNANRTVNGEPKANLNYKVIEHKLYKKSTSRPELQREQIENVCSE
jgi:hypothetical protein